MTLDPTSDTAVCVNARELTLATLDGLRHMMLHSDVTFERKPDGSVVSATDHTIHQTFVQAIANTFPEHAVISEEGQFGSGAGRYRWVIDPLDGTSNFTSGLPYWCVSIALTCDGHVVLSVIDAPALNLRFVATKGDDGWWQNGHTETPLAVREPVDVFDPHSRQIPLLLAPTTLVNARTHKVALRQRVLGATALDLAFVANGTAAASVAVVPHVWDVASGVLLVQAAGGVVLAETDVLLPLQPYVSYHDRQGAVVAASTEPQARQLAQLLLPPERAAALSLLSSEH